MKILVLTRYSSLGASSRYRFYQYIPYFQDQGAQITIEPLLGDNYINYLYNKTNIPLIEIIKKYFERIFSLLKKNKFDIIWLQQEAFPWLPAWFETALTKSKIPLIVDYDDAFFHRYDQHSSNAVKFFLKYKIDKVMNSADLVVAGNRYLSDRAIKNKTKKVVILPTVVDINCYSTESLSDDKLFTIGWIGSPSTAKYLFVIQNALEVIYKLGDVKVVLVGSGSMEMENLPLEIRKWNESTEVKDIQSFDVGIMPLTDSLWERGKCGFKLIQYMACGKPVVASPIGINAEIVKHGVNGFLANNQEEWVKYFEILRNDRDLRKRMGIAGRKLVEEKYSLQVNAPKLIQEFKNLLQEKRD